MPTNKLPSNWKPLYEAAMRETDPARITERIAVARTAILEQIEKSIRNPAIAEHYEMDKALRNLRKRTASAGSNRPGAVA